MHTVNKAYSLLKQEGYLKLDRRKGAVIYVSEDKKRALEEMIGELRVCLAKAVCRNITREEIHEVVDQLYNIYTGETV
jgi:DNA-binding transcriptional regulator YhcF (GntR family)